MIYYIHTTNITFLCHISIPSLYSCSYSYIVSAGVSSNIPFIKFAWYINWKCLLNTNIHWAWKYTVQLLAIYSVFATKSGSFEKGINLFAFLRKQNNTDIFKSTTISTLLNLCLICSCTIDIQAHFIFWSWLRNPH